MYYVFLIGEKIHNFFVYLLVKNLESTINFEPLMLESYYTYYTYVQFGTKPNKSINHWTYFIFLHQREAL